MRPPAMGNSPADLSSCRGTAVASGIEEVLYGAAKVAECTAVGKPDDILGQTVIAFIVLEPDGGLEADDLRRYCAGVTGSSKIPSESLIVRTPPKGQPEEYSSGC